jgi:hypothetical protein
MVVDARAVPCGRGGAHKMYDVRPAIVVFAMALVAAGCATGGQAPTSSAPPPTTSAPPSKKADPTQGRFINATTWSLRVWVGGPPANSASPATVTLKPGETVSWTLAQGQHRIVAHAYPVARSSDKAVARFDRTIALDPQRPEGWFLRFREADFR